LTEEQLEASAVDCVGQMMTLTDAILDLEPRARVAVLQSLILSMKSILSPGTALTISSLEQGAELLAEAEKKLSQKAEMTAIGFRVGVIRSKLESSNDG